SLRKNDLKTETNLRVAKARLPSVASGFAELPRKKCERSDAHGHNDVAIAVAVVGQRTHLAGGLFILEFDADRAIGSRGKKIKNVGRIEPNRDGIAFVFLFDGFFRFTILGARSGN